jgi:heme/copper-type cytochrome/quinol oxidase subunit 3
MEAVAMTEAKAESRRPRRPGPAVVIWGSIALFAVLFALFTYQLSAPAQAPQQVLVRKLVKRRVVTTVVPTPGASTVTAGPAVSSTQSTSGATPVTTGAS